MKRPLEMALLFFMALSASAAAESYFFFPHIASGGGWITELYFTNQGTAAVSGIKVNFYDNAGAAQSVDTNIGSGTSCIFGLDKGANLVIGINPSSTVVVGYAEVVYPASSYVRAGEIYRYKPGETVLTEVGISQQKLFNNFSFPVKVDSSKHLNTAIALTNPSDINSAQTVVMTLIKPDGSVQASAVKSLSNGQHFSEYLPQSLFPGLDNFTGSISVSCPLGVALLALRQDNEAFGSISTDYGPILGPFMLSSTAVNEVEPNDSFAQAQVISGSTIISGSIGVSQDTDVYSFAGKQGDVVSVVCEAKSIGSAASMDPVLGIFRAYNTQSVLALNLDSGLSGTGDCFLQMMLPADDTYYIVIQNSYTNYGSDYLYKLHIRLP
jgi:hypothetical protein